MTVLKKFLAGLAAFVGANATQANNANDRSAAPTTADFDGVDSNFSRSVVLRNNRQRGFGWILAAHSSHSSHASHGSHGSHSSHYSGSGGGSYTTPADTPTPAPDPPRKATPPQGVYSPPATDDAAGAEAAKLIMRVQLALNARGYCNCAVDGKLGVTTVAAIKKFQTDNTLASTGLLDETLLKKLGIAL